ncbi:DUF5689 domain-containing protein [Mucilaginibacter paludis]|uniref:DUF5689 domain-containing protein n=1 Tax=Mucilaginibacter paludis DSM 18603 TaxID=714943 RepID=H1YHW1_9SPHI|nr:DUF5689 domain-containing protein [Mucilaginibacter paludis]EHQ27511.1 hypothetical protein Mucpa_3412 [Mucilaginibacter paludis DSM 18603]
MKTKITFRAAGLVLLLALGMTSCKKNNGNDNTAPVPVDNIAVSDLKKLSTAASVTVPDGRKIKGIVISDASAKNIDAKSIVLQEATDKPGIIINFDGAHNFALNDEVEVTISKQQLSQVNGEIILDKIPVANAKKTGTGAITAKVTTAADLVTNQTAWNGMLVSLPVDGLTGGNGKFTGNLVVQKGNQIFGSKVLSGATFENTDYPVSVSNITGILRIDGSNLRVDIRTTADLASGPYSRIVTEDFQNLKKVSDGSAIVVPSTANAPFTTAVGQWLSTVQSFNFYPGATYDATFTTPTRTYLYAFNTSVNTTGASLRSNFTNNQGLKKVAISFAATSAEKVVTVLSQREYAFTFGTTDSVKIAVLPILPDNMPLIDAGDNMSYDAVKPILALSPAYNQKGKFFTFEYTIPTKDELIAKGVSADRATAFIANPQFRIYNASRPFTGSPNAAPILFDKIVFYY